MNSRVCVICGKPAECLCSVGSLCEYQPLCKECTDNLYIGVSPFDSIDKEVFSFIDRRFKCDCNWTSGNCYYFALILKDRFSNYNAQLYYDTIDGHFLCMINGSLYDWYGKHSYYKDRESSIICWDKFKEYDALQYERIIRDVIK